MRQGAVTHCASSRRRSARTQVPERMHTPTSRRNCEYAPTFPRCGTLFPACLMLACRSPPSIPRPESGGRPQRSGRAQLSRRQSLPRCRLQSRHPGTPPPRQNKQPQPAPKSCAPPWARNGCVTHLVRLCGQRTTNVESSCCSARRRDVSRENLQPGMCPGFALYFAAQPPRQSRQSRHRPARARDGAVQLRARC